VERLILMLKKSKLKSHLAQHNFLHAKWCATKKTNGFASKKLRFALIWLLLFW
jgi:hypothetical protein